MKLFILILYLLFSKLSIMAQYKGGIGNGYLLSISNNLNLSLVDSLYNGNIGSGYSKAIMNLNLGIIDSLYNGSNGTGFNKIIASNINLSLQDSLYNGGAGIGETMLASKFIKLGICSDTYTWNGNKSINWSNVTNWDCGTLPTITTNVVIPSGLVHYPVITTNTFIKSLHLETNTTIFTKNLIIN